MFKFKIIFIIFVLALSGCSTMRDSAGVGRKTIDEFQVIENPPLVIPPDFYLLPPDQMEEKNIDDIEKDLAKEILFGLDENESERTTQLSTMSQILENSKSFNVQESIREEIDIDFANEIKAKGFFKTKWESKTEVLDAVEESKRIRNNNFDDKLIEDNDLNIQTKKIKLKKKKRFFLF